LDSPNYHIGLLIIQMSLPDCHSLKEKRRVVKSLKDRAKAHHNISIAEIGELDKWQYAAIGVTAISNDKKIIDRTFQAIRTQVESSIPGFILDSHMSFI
jgi:uncharacterized protein YlxP (DUF503 family)